MGEKLVQVINDVDRIAFDNLQHKNLQTGSKEDEDKNKRPLTSEELQQGQTDWEQYLESRPTEEDVTSPGATSLYTNEYFDAKRDKHYHQTHDNPAELPAAKLFDRFIDAEAGGNGTFVEDYGKALAEKLDEKTVPISELAKLQAEAEFKSEVNEADAPRTAELVAGAIERRITAFHNQNLGKSREAYQVQGENGQVCTITPHEDAAFRTDSFRARIERLKDRHLAELREKRTSQSENEAPTDHADYEPDWVIVDDQSGHEEDGFEDGNDKNGSAHDESLTPETELLPESEEPKYEDSEDEDEFFDGEPQAEEKPADEENKRFAKFKQGVRKHLREYPIKDAPPKPEGYEHPLDKFDRLYTFPFKAKVNDRAAELRDSIKRAAERGMERHEFLRRAGHIGQVVVTGAAGLPQRWDQYLIEMSQVPQASAGEEVSTEETAVSPAEQVDNEIPVAVENEAHSDEEQATVHPEVEEVSEKKVGRISRILRNAGILSDEIRESFRRQEEESEKNSEDE